ncbi:O-antigen ligase family protein [Kolteria novifilia]
MGGRLAAIGLALAVAIVAGRTFYPSEDAADGSGVIFILLEMSLGLIALACWIAGAKGPKPGAVTWSWGVLLGAIAVSTLSAAYQFPAKILLWEWVGAGMLLLFLRQQTGRTSPMPMAGLVVSLALTQSLIACWQVGVEHPRLRKMYEERHPDVLAEIEMMGIAPGSGEERLFRDRLYAPEAYGTFGHPNSLAGLLVLGLPLLVAAAELAWRWPTRPWRLAGVGIAVAIVLMGLLLTRSRSAWLAALCGLGVMAVFHPRGVRVLWPWRRWLLLAGLGLGLAVAMLSLVGVFDWLVIVESSKSLRYRAEWWWGTLGVIEDHPLFGTGFGNFGSAYLEHKLPFSSEEIRDPHNFVLELLAGAGPVALVAYLAALGFALRELWERNDQSPDTDASTLPGGTPLWWWAGVVLAAVMLIWFAFPGWAGWLGMGFWAFALVAVSGFRARAAAKTASLEHAGVEPIARAVFAGTLALHVHWLAAGGINYPGLLLPCWALLAASSGRISDWSPNFSNQVTTAVGLLILAGMFLQTLYFPLVERDRILAEVRSISMEGGSRALERRTSAQRYLAKSQPGDASHWAHLGQLETARMERSARDRGVAQEAYRQAELAWKRAIQLDPRRAAHHRGLAQTYQAAGKMGLDRQGYAKSVASWDEVIARYPNLAANRFGYAEALMLLGKKNKAKDEFERALELDRTPHPDKKLSEAQRRMAEQFVEP